MNFAFETKEHSTKKNKKSSKGRFNCLKIGTICTYTIFNATQKSMYSIVFDKLKLSNLSDTNNIPINNLNITDRQNTKLEIIDIQEDIDIENLMDKIKSRFAIYIEK